MPLPPDASINLSPVPKPERTREETLQDLEKWLETKTQQPEPPQSPTSAARPPFDWFGSMVYGAVVFVLLVMTPLVHMMPGVALALIAWASAIAGMLLYRRLRE